MKTAIMQRSGSGLCLNESWTGNPIDAILSSIMDEKQYLAIDNSLEYAFRFLLAAQELEVAPRLNDRDRRCLNGQQRKEAAKRKAVADAAKGGGRQRDR